MYKKVDPLRKVTKITSKHTVDVNGVPRHVRDMQKRRHGRTVDVGRRLLRAMETDPSVQGDEGPGMLEMLKVVGLGGMPQQHNADVVIEKRRPNAGARLPTEGV